MCAQYLLEMDPEGLASRLETDLEDVWRDYDSRIVPYRLGPVLVLRRGQRLLRVMSYSLVPSWATEPKMKFATHNARLHSVDPKTGRDVSIYQKPTWEKSFRKYHCVVPLSKFIEPIYENEYAGNMVQFFDQKEPVLLAAGLYSEWVNKTGEVIPTFAIITDDPPEYIAKIGHDRCPVFLASDTLDVWLRAEMPPAEATRFLREKVAHPEFSVGIDRPLKAGWEKRR